MNPDEFRRLLETYGTVQTNWPVEVREAAREYLASSREASDLAERFAPLDIALDRFDTNPDTARIRAAVMARIGSRNIIDRITGWLLPDLTDLHAIWRPALAASLPLILGIILGSTMSIGSTDTADSWSDEITLVALANNDSESLP